MNQKLYLFSLLLLCQLATFAQDSTDVDRPVKHHNHIYPSWGGDGPILSFGNVKYNGEHINTIPRFTFFFNIGRNVNYDITPWLGVFSGINIKNIGLITKDSDSLKLKRRVYTLGIPLGLKIGDVKHNDFFFFLGASYDLAFNYKEKKFIDGKKVHKYNEWFSDKTPLLMPSVFAGVRFYPGIGLKVQYYPNNFFKQDNVESKLFFVTLSYDFHTSLIKRYRDHYRLMRDKPY